MIGQLTNPSVVGSIVFGAIGVSFVYCFFRPESWVARMALESPRYTRSLGRGGFLLFAALSFVIPVLVLVRH